MHKIEFEESDLVFHFPPHWGVREYDNQRFYKNMSGLGLKGVDFLLIDPIGAGHLYLVEVKNYRTRIREDASYHAELKPTEELAAIVTAKYEHTQRAIGAIQLYYKRKWWHSMLTNFLRKSRHLEYDAIFWAQAYHLAQNSRQHTLLLWIETEVASQSYEQELQQRLKSNLTKGLEVKLANQQRPFPPGIIVR